MRVKSVNISGDVETVLRGGTWSGDVFQLNAPKLDRALYVATDKVLQALGGRWNRGAKGHKFAADARQALIDALDTGGVVDRKKTLEQFFTPPALAERMVGALDIREGTKVLEPSAGNGRLIWQALERGADVLAVEIDEDLCAQLNLEVRERQKPGDLLVISGDFLAVKMFDRPDVVIMNPPFSHNQDVAHVTRAFTILRPGGKLAAIMSRHFTFANDEPSKTFRDLIRYEAPQGHQADRYFCGGEGVVEDCTVELLPLDTFKAEGANVSAVLVLMEKAA